MKNNMTKKALIALATIILTQPLMAIYTVNSNDCYAPVNIEANTINVSKFNNVWQKLHRNNAKTGVQTHLQKYIDNTLDDSKGTLDVAKFSALWLNFNNSEGQAHLGQSIRTLLENSSTKSYPCPSAPLCDASIDVAKFSVIWHEVKVNNNNSVHLNTELNSLVNATVCSL